MELKVSVVQMGPYVKDPLSNLEKAVSLLERSVGESHPDVVAFTEMMTTPYFCGVIDDRYFGLAETLAGRTVTTLARKARELDTCIIGTFFEKEEPSRGGKPRYFNSAGVFTPKEGLSGVYRKCHIPKVHGAGMITDEKYYFEPGDGLKTFRVNGVDFGILICYDRSFPEAWRTLRLKGAKVVFVSVATYGFREQTFLKEIEVHAFENHLYAVVANKAGEESVERETYVRRHFGNSCIIDPYGNQLANIGDVPFGILHGTLDLGRIDEAEKVLSFQRDRRPELYGEIVRPIGTGVSA